MRPLAALLTVGLTVIAAPLARAADLRFFEDAALHAVQFVDDLEGWAVGDEGVVWHTTDGGGNWERQPTGVRGSLRSVCFLDGFNGWVVGREELPDGGSAGVVLYTRDQGHTWQRLLDNSIAGLNQVRFTGPRTGFVLGDGTDKFPTGVFRTTDGGHTWGPVHGPRSPSWLAGDFQDQEHGALAGAWSRLALLRDGNFTPANVDQFGGRSLRGMRALGDVTLAVGQGGLILTSRSGGSSYAYASPNLPEGVLAAWDFHALYSVGHKVWVVGRPGSAVLFSADRGATWKVYKTGQPLPLNGVFFLDEQRGWAVGELGTILGTRDGGATWKVQRQGGKRAAVLFLHARAGDLPVETVAALGADQGYLTAGLRVTAPDPASAAPAQAVAGQRFAAALRRAGGAAGEMLWQFPAPQHLEDADRAELLKSWDQAHGGRAAQELLRQLVLALRTWRPDVVVTDHPDAQTGGWPGGALVAEALHAAFSQAADPSAFPEQVQQMGLAPWRVSRVYALWDGQKNPQLVLDNNQVSPRLHCTMREFATAAAALLSTAPVLPSRRGYRLLDGEAGGALPQHLLEGIRSEEGDSRRPLPPADELTAEQEKAIRERHSFQVLIEAPAGGLADPSRLLPQVEPLLNRLPYDDGAAAALALANQYVRTGQWLLAQETFLMMVERYPAHPLSVDAYRWLVRYNTSSEARRRVELNQFKQVRDVTFAPPQMEGKTVPVPENLKSWQQPGIFAIRAGEPQQPSQQKPNGNKQQVVVPGEPINLTPPGKERKPMFQSSEAIQRTTLQYLNNQGELRKWYTGSLELGKRLQGLGPLFGDDPALQFCLQSARRNLGEFQEADKWYQRCKDMNVAAHWRAAAETELWLSRRTGSPPRPYTICRQTATRPFLDGNFEDPCWQGLKPLVLQNAAPKGDPARDPLLSEYRTEVRFAYDQEFLYLALRCTHPAGRHLPPVKVRPRDADLRAHDRVSILLDLDRDYSTYFHLQVDQRGCACEDCWGDRSWNPRWFVALRSGETSWQIEAAVPLTELTRDRLTLNTVWACNVVRVLPGRGVEAMSLPADVQPRPEGMGLLVFTDNPAEQVRSPAQVPPRP